MLRTILTTLEEADIQGSFGKFVDNPRRDVIFQFLIRRFLHNDV